MIIPVPKKSTVSCLNDYRPEKLSLLNLNTPLCNRILDFLTERPQTVRIGNNVSLNSGGPVLITPHCTSIAPLWRRQSTKFLGVHITDDVTWTIYTTSLAKKAQQRLYFLQRLRATLPTGTTGEHIFQLLNEFIKENGIDWIKCVRVCTDGARAMTTRHSSVVGRIREVAPEINGHIATSTARLLPSRKCLMI
ncbi:ZBED5 protein, partial [Atractosteus spatula]|nr:ZBED5 protein [Atractosteus spatula]